MDQRADWAMVVGEAFATCWIGGRVEVVGWRLRVGERARVRARRRWREVLEMHVAERNRELERQRKQRQIRTRSFTRPEPTHRRHASRVSCRGRPFCRYALAALSNNVTLPRFGPSGGSVAIHLACCKKSSLGMRMPDRFVQFSPSSRRANGSEASIRWAAKPAI